MTTWTPLRAASTATHSAHFIADYTSGYVVHRWTRRELPVEAPTFLVSRNAGRPGYSEPPAAILDVLPRDVRARVPREFERRFMWSSRPERLGDKHPSGWTSYLDPHNPGDVSGAFVTLHPTAAMPGVSDSWLDRTPLAAFDTRSGLPLTRRELGTGWEYRLDRGRDRIQNLPDPRWERDTNTSVSGWEACDEYHLERPYMTWLAEWRETRNPLARWAIVALAADALLAYQPAVIPATSAWQPFSLGRMLIDAQRTPHRGGRIVRGVAWVLRLLAAAVEVGTHQLDETRTAISGLVRYAKLVQLPSGAFYDAPWADANGVPTWADNGEAWLLYGMDTRLGECPSWQIPFLVRALWEAQVAVPELRREVTSIVRGAMRVWETCPRVVDRWGGAPGLPYYLATSFDRMPVESVTAGVGESNSMYDADAFAVFVRAGCLAKLPRVYAVPGQPGITDDAVRVAAEFGVED